MPCPEHRRSYALVRQRPGVCIYLSEDIQLAHYMLQCAVELQRSGFLLQGLCGGDAGGGFIEANGSISGRCFFHTLGCAIGCLLKPWQQEYNKWLFRP